MDFGQLVSLSSGHMAARTVQVALDLGFFEALEASPKDAEMLAEAIQCSARGTELVANALVSLGLLMKEAGRYRLAEPARLFLVESSPQYLGGMIRFEGLLFDCWARLRDSVRNGAPVRTTDMYQTRPEETELFARGMDSLVRARGDARYLAEHLDLSGVGFIVDLGGGPGTYAAEFVRQRPSLRAAIWDLPGTLEVARKILSVRDPDLLERIQLRPVNYLTDEFPEPCDALFLSNVIHIEDARTNEMLMRKCFRALRPGGQLLIKDYIMNRELTEPAAGTLFSVQMMLVTHGRNYSFEEISGWLTGAGFEEVHLENLPDRPFSSPLVIARKSRERSG